MNKLRLKILTWLIKYLANKNYSIACNIKFNNNKIERPKNNNFILIHTTIGESLSKKRSKRNG